MACGRACGGRGRSVLKQQETRHDPAWPGKIHQSLWQEPTRYTSPLHPALLVVIDLMSFVTPSEAEYSENHIRFSPMPAGNSLVSCDKSGHTKFPFSSVILSWGELWLICPELPLILP